MSAINKFKNKIGNTIQGDGGEYLVEFVISACTDHKKINLGSASYKLDRSNKVLLIEILKSLIFDEQEQWDDVEILNWIEKNQPYVFEKVMIKGEC